MKTCTKEGCEAKHAAKGFCVKHYAEYRRSLPKVEGPIVETTSMRLQGTVPVERLGEFQYSASEQDLQYYEGNPDASPLHVPDAIKNRYPNMDFRWVSEAKWNKLGKNWQGWQRFQDTSNPEGMKRGNDLFLAAMPKERAQRYRDHVANESIERIRAAQGKALTAQIGETMTAKELEAMGASGATPGLSIGRKPQTRTQYGNRTIVGGGYVRGMSKSEVRDIVRKEIADRKKNRVYSFASK